MGNSKSFPHFNGLFLFWFFFLFVQGDSNVDNSLEADSYLAGLILPSEECNRTGL